MGRKVRNQDIDANHERPQGKDQRGPAETSDAQEQKERQHVTEQRHPAREHPNADRESAGRDHEYARHP